ncbi:MAG: UbiA family prenyltransferase [Nitrososphaerota archaeon]|nr:UbiA family prenyltransferase [Nitrososphaerota archaeon]MDG6977436.1 UbiA family prenyltransferase [Nitrososphaerota archaeon]
MDPPQLQAGDGQDRRRGRATALLTSAYREFVLGGHLLAIGTASIAAASAALMGLTATPLLLFMAYLFSYGAYMMNRSTEMDSDAVSHPDRTAHLGSRKRYLPAISAGCFLLGYVLAYTVNLIFFGALLVPLAFSALYSVGSRRLVGVIGVSKLKDKLLVKNLFISLGWSLIPVLVGLYYLRFEEVLALMGGLIFLRLMVNTLIFDVRDVEGDRAQGIRTVPAVYGVRRTYTMMTAIDGVALAYLAAAVSFGLLPLPAIVLALLPAYSIFYAYLAKKPGADLGFICDVVVDGEYLLWGPLMYIGAALI